MKITFLRINSTIDEYGLPNEPKYSHLNELHNVLNAIAPIVLPAMPSSNSSGKSIRCACVRNYECYGRACVRCVRVRVLCACACACVLTSLCALACVCACALWLVLVCAYHVYVCFVLVLVLMCLRACARVCVRALINAACHLSDSFFNCM